MEKTERVFKLSSGDLVIGNAYASEDGQSITIEFPYTVIDQRLVPYEMMSLIEPMEYVTINAFYIMWNKRLVEFPKVYKSYRAATKKEPDFIGVEEKKIIV